MPAYKSIRLKKEFDLIYRKGKSVHGIFFSLRFLESKNPEEVSRFGIVVGLAISKKAVLRNGLRRKLKEIVRLNHVKIKKGFWVLILPKEEALKASYQELEKEFLSLGGKSGILVK